MMLYLYSIKDIYNGFAPPVVMPNNESALRWFEDMKIQNPTIGNNPEDFTIHLIGTMNSETGEIIPADEVNIKKMFNSIQCTSRTGGRINDYICILGRKKKQ